LFDVQNYECGRGVGRIVETLNGNPAEGGKAET